jgi:tetratricopeptide (TPR) repeat protein
MLNLRPGNVPGLTRAAYLRELHGNLAGALELMQMAYDSVAFSESEDRAWLLTQMAHLKLLDGGPSGAEKYASEALTTFPDYPRALSVLAQVRSAQSRYPEAVTLLAKRYAAAPSARILYALAEAQELAGRREEAAASFREFERQARTQWIEDDNSNRELIFYYLDHAGEPEKALEIAEREVKVRQDIFTLDCYAWALAGTGDYEGASMQLHKALAMNAKDPTILFHAGAIALRLHQTGRAEEYLKDAASRYCPRASKLLRDMQAQSEPDGR